MHAATFPLRKRGASRNGTCQNATHIYGTVPVHMEIRMKAFLAHLVRAAMFVVRALLHCAWFAMRPALAMLCYLLAQYLAAFVAFCAITLMLR